MGGRVTDTSDILRFALGRWGMCRMVARGNSMVPFVLPNEEVMILCAHELQIGCLAVYRNVNSGQLVLHRVVRLANGMAYLIGDGSVEMSITEESDCFALAGALFLPDAGIWAKIPFSSPQSIEVANLSFEIGQLSKKDDRLMARRTRVSSLLRSKILSRQYGIIEAKS